MSMPKKLQFWLFGGVAVLLLVGVLLIAFMGGNTSEEKKAIANEEAIANKFDGYNWSWYCWDTEVEFTLWKENIEHIEQQGDYWLILGMSSDLGSKGVSLDESGKILIVYDFTNDKVTHSRHGGEIPENPKVDTEGRITTPGMIEYC